MPQATAISFNDNASVAHVLTPMGIENGWTVWRQTTPTPATPLDGFVVYARVKNPPLNAKDPKASRRAEFRAYWRETTPVEGVPVVSQQLFAEINYVLPLTATADRCEHYRAFIAGIFTANTPAREVVTKGYPLT